VPSLLEAARKFLDFPDESRRAVAKAVLDVTGAGRDIKAALLSRDRNVDLATYFDFWFGDSVACTQKLVDSGDIEARCLAECLIQMERQAIKARETFLTEMKRVGIKPKG
jgi:hypothetical protein